MKFRAKLLTCLTALVLLTLAGTILPFTRALRDSFDRLSAESFQNARHSVASLRAERVKGMRLAGAMIMNSPDLRSLIADSVADLSKDKIASLEDRLTDILGAINGQVTADGSKTEIPTGQFAALVDARGSVIAKTKNCPWDKASEMEEFVARNPQGSSLVRSSLRMRAGDESPDGIWVCRGGMYQVVAIPLIFGSERADGSLLIASQFSDSLAAQIARAHNCELSFFAGGSLLATSITGEGRNALAGQLRGQSWPRGAAFQTELPQAYSSRTYSSWLQAVVDPSTGQQVGGLLLQGDTQEANAVRGRAVAIMAVIAAASLVIAVAVSLYLSGRLTRPIKILSEGVAVVGTGDLSHSLPDTGKDELGQLGKAFNEMIVQLRQQRELQQLVAETQAATKAKSQFLANMSHEIRTPLHGVIGMVNLLTKTGLDDRQKRLTSLAKSSASVLATLINDILDLSKIESGKLEFEAVDLDLYALIEDIVELLSEKAYAKGIEIFSEIEPGTPQWIRGDPTRLRQILINLTGNAVKFTEKGAVTILVTPDRFEIKDTGIGIPADRMGRLFQQFSQVDASTTRKFGGTGLGLAISKQLVEAMSGVIGVESELGKGTTFWFILPLPPAAVVPTVVAPPNLAGKSVLVVDAAELSRDHVAKKLALLGLRVSTDASEGPFDYAVGTPGFTGPPKALHVLMATGEQAMSRKQARNQGYASVVTKPVRLTQLAEALVLASEPLSEAEASDSTAKPKNGYRLLVAEDTEANQIVAGEILSEEGYEVVIVADGQQAVEAWEKGGIDLILMDCQMPVLDGFEATSAIRGKEPEGTRIPILALTANASGADRGRCLAAGMDGYCSKPFEPVELFRTLTSFLPPKVISARAAGEKSTHPLPESQSATELLPDAQSTRHMSCDGNIDVAAMLQRCNGKPTLAAAVLGKFDKQAQEAVVNLDKHLTDNDVVSITKVAHALKGTAGVICAEALRADAARLEAIGRDGGGESLAGAAASVRASLISTIASAAELAEQFRSRNAKSGSAAA